MLRTSNHHLISLIDELAAPVPTPGVNLTRFEDVFVGAPDRPSSKHPARITPAKRREEYLQRIPIEGKFGQGKNGYRLNYIRAKRADTSVAWINSIFLVMNLIILLKVFFVPWIKVV